MRIELHSNADEAPPPGNPTTLLATIDAKRWNGMTDAERAAWIAEQCATHDYAPVWPAWLVLADDPAQHTDPTPVENATPDPATPEGTRPSPTSPPPPTRTKP